MSTDTILGRNELFSAMHNGTPFRSYRKTILGQLAVNLWDNFIEKPTEIILKGDPKRNDESCIIDVWSEKEDIYFTRVNRRHFSTGMLIPYQRPERPVVEKSVEQSTDEELTAIVNMKFLALSSKVNKIDSTAVLFRMLNIAEGLDKSEKITRVITSRISELQAGEVNSKKVVETTEED